MMVIQVREVGMPARDETAWEPVAGDHGDDVTYQRIRLNPEAPPTDEVQTAEEIAATEEANEEAEAEALAGIDATDGAVEAANELGIDLANVTGTGTDGRITKADVEAAAA